MSVGFSFRIILSTVAFLIIYINFEQNKFVVLNESSVNRIAEQQKFQFTQI